MNKEQIEAMLPDCPDLLTVAGLQDCLHIGRTKAYQLVSSNQIRSFKIGASVRIPKAALVEYILREASNAS